MQQSQPRTWTWKGANHDYHQKFWKSILNKQGPLRWACRSTEFLKPNVMAIPQWKNVYNALPSSKILSFSYSYFSPKKTKCDSKNLQKDSQWQQPATPPLDHSIKFWDEISGNWSRIWRTHQRGEKHGKLSRRKEV